MKKGLLLCVVLACLSSAAQDYVLVWSDEFEGEGRPSEANWGYEGGFVRNEELQWYQPDNAWLHDGLLVIEARPEQRANPLYEEGSRDWRKSRQAIECTSAALESRGKFEFCFGRVEVRARIPLAKGSWPAIWTLGTQGEWPSNGEIDIMEFYRRQGEPVIMANAAWASEQRWNARWQSVATPLTHFLGLDPDWGSEFHVWRMDWTEDYIRLYLDDELLNEIDLSKTINQTDGRNPFHSPHYLLLNLAVGGQNGGPVSADAYPIRYEVDYVRVYQQQ